MQNIELVSPAEGQEPYNNPLTEAEVFYICLGKTIADSTLNLIKMEEWLDTTVKDFPFLAVVSWHNAWFLVAFPDTWL